VASFDAFPELISRLGIDPRHLVHVGAHKGEEMPYYRAAGFRHITLVEPNPQFAAELATAWPDAEVLACACAAQEGRGTLHLMRRTTMSTLTAPGPQDEVAGTAVVEVRRLADIAPTANAAVIDAQGLELDVLRGADIDRLDVVVIEATTVPDPSMAALYDDVAAFMNAAGFTEVDRWVQDYGWVHQRARSRPTDRQGEVGDFVFVRSCRGS
jgi:FkbM family methyltransferase